MDPVTADFAAASLVSLAPEDVRQVDLRGSGVRALTRATRRATPRWSGSPPTPMHIRHAGQLTHRNGGVAHAVLQPWR